MYDLLTSDGQRIAVYAYGPRDVDEAAVLLHGCFLDHRVFEAQIPLLLRQKRRVVAPDLRGFGGSAGAEAGVFLARMALDVYELVKWEGLHGVTLVGHGLGAAVALRYLRLFSGFRVRRAVLLSAGGLSPDAAQVYRVQRAEGQAEAAAWFCRRMWAQPPSEARLRWAEQIAFGASGIAAEAALDAWLTEDWAADLEGVAVPVQFLHGARDTLTPPAMAEALCRHAKNGAWRLLESAGHALPLEGERALDAALGGEI